MKIDFNDRSGLAPQIIESDGAAALIDALVNQASESYPFSIDLESISDFGSILSQRVWNRSYYGVECPTEETSDDPWLEDELIEKTVAVLNAFAEQGWDVVRVSEDRGLYDGVESKVSAVTGIRHWLIKC